MDWAEQLRDYMARIEARENEETETDADSERALAHRWGFDSEPWEEPAP